MLRFSSVTLALAVLAGCHTENQLTGPQYQEPVLSLDDPGVAAWMPEGDVEASGTAENLEQVTVNGSAVNRTDGAFTGHVHLDHGINVVEASGVDMNGDTRFVRNGVIAGDFADPGKPVDDAVEVRVNQGGLDVAMSEAAKMITLDTVQSSMTAANPVYQDSYGVWGWDAVNVRADITGIYFDQPTLKATPTNGYLALEADIPNFWVQITASGDVVGIDFSVDVWMWADVAQIVGDLTVDAQNGKLVADLPSATVNLVGFGYDTSLLPGDVEDYILVDTIRGFVESTLVSQIEEKVPPLLQDQLASLDLSTSTDLMGHTLDIDADIADAHVDSDGLALAVDLDVYTPSAGDLTYAGYLADGPGRPDPSRSADLGVSVSDDLLNRVLFEVWRGGLLDMHLSTDDGSLQPIMLAPLKATQGSIDVSAALPPVIVQKDGKLQAQIGELDVKISTPDGEMGTYLDAMVVLYVDLDLKVEDGVLKLDLGEPQVVITVRDSDWGASNEATTQLVQQMLPIDTMMLLLGDLSFPLPTIGDLSVKKANVDREDSGVRTGIDVNL